MKKALFAGTIALLVAGLAFCGKKEDTQKPDAVPGPFGIARTVWDSVPTPQDRVNLAAKVKDKDIELTGGEKATIETNKGTIVAELYSKDAPNTVRNFIRLAESGFYDGLIWHRYEPGFVIQGGDPLGRGSGNAGYQIPFEDNDRKHELGALGMARGADFNSASCQFYICLEPQAGLDGSYVVFGKVLEGMDVAKTLRVGDSIRMISISRDSVQ